MAVLFCDSMIDGLVFQGGKWDFNNMTINSRIASRHSGTDPLAYYPSFNTASAAAGYAEKLIAPGPTVSAGIALRTSGTGDTRREMLAFRAGGVTLATVNSGNDQSVNLRAGDYLGTILHLTPANVLGTAWASFAVTLTIAGASGQVLFYVNDQLVYQATHNFGTTNVDALRVTNFTSGASTSARSAFQDLWITDGAALENARIHSIRPAADGLVTDWTPLSGTNNAAMVNNADPNTATYNYTSAPGLVDLFTIPALASDPLRQRVSAVQVNVLANKTTADAQAMRTLTRPAGASFSGDETAILGRTVLRTLHPTNPATANQWSLAAVNATQFGYMSVGDATYDSLVITSGPDAFYKLDEATGASLADAMGGPAITATGGGWVYGIASPFGDTVRIDGTSSYADTLRSVWSAKPWAFEMLVNLPAGLASGYKGLLVANSSYGLYNNGTLNFYNMNILGGTVSADLRDSAWHLLTVSAPSGGGNTQVFLDGVNLGATSVAYDNAGTMKIGGYGSEGAGGIGFSRVSLWNKAITLAEHQQRAAMLGF
jgi:hypothetical protein